MKQFASPRWIVAGMVMWILAAQAFDFWLTIRHIVISFSPMIHGALAALLLLTSLGLKKISNFRGLVVGIVAGVIAAEVGESLLFWDLKVAVLPGHHTTYYSFLPTLPSRICSILLLLQLLFLGYARVFDRRDFYDAESMENLNWTIFWLAVATVAAAVWDLVSAWYGGYLYEQLAFFNRTFGKGWLLYFLVFQSFTFLPLFFIFQKIRKNLAATVIVCLLGLAFVLVFN